MDAKRGDISSTAVAYAETVFETLKADAVTLNPYLGGDSILPFIEDSNRGAFLLCKTSNPGSKDIQDEVLLNGFKVYEHVASLAQSWNTNDNLGIVVGATHLEALEKIRIIAPDLWILAPGIGLQGGNLIEAVQKGLRSDGSGILVPVSRGISRADNPFEAAKTIKDQINQARKQKKVPVNNKSLNKLAQELFDAGCVKVGEFTLKSGIKSPIYLDLRQLVSHPLLLAQIAKAYRTILKGLDFNRIAALPYAALPIGTTISLQGNIPMIYPRKEVKEYGTKVPVEGDFEKGETIAVIDDLTTTGATKFESIEKLESVGLRVKDIIVLIDRESGAKELLAKDGYRLHTVFTLTDLVVELAAQGKISTELVGKVKNFIQESAPK